MGARPPLISGGLAIGSGGIGASPRAVRLGPGAPSEAFSSLRSRCLYSDVAQDLAEPVIYGIHLGSLEVAGLSPCQGFVGGGMGSTGAAMTAGAGLRWYRWRLSRCAR
jgi:hypothetical protein